MRIKSLAASNIKGFETFSLECGECVAALGKNGSNKTSLIQLVVGLFGKAQPRMLRAGATSGEIRAVIEDEGETWEIRRSFEPGKAKAISIKSSSAGRLGAPATFLESILDSVSIDPIGQAMNASEERQAEIILETIPLTLDKAKLIAAVADVASPEVNAALKKAEKLPALDALKLVANTVYDLRTDVNREAKSKKINGQQLRESIGPEAQNGVDWGAKAQAIQEEIQALASKQTETRIAAEKHTAGARMNISELLRAEKETIDKEIDAQIRLLEAERTKRTDAAKALAQSAVDTLMAEHQAALKQLEDDTRPERERLITEQAEARKNAEGQQRAAQTVKIAEEAERVADLLEKKSTLMTAAIAHVDAIREDLMKNLPIPGLKVEAGVPYLNGVPLSEINTQRRTQFWVKIGAMRAKDLGIVCADGLECLDTAHFDSFVAAAKQTGLQWFISRLSDSDFHIVNL